MWQVAFLSGISQIQKYVYMSHSPVFLGSDQLDRTCIENLILSSNVYIFRFFSYLAVAAVSVQ